jgi:hypothetical protein
LHYTLIARDSEVNEIQRASAKPLSEYDPTAVLALPHLKEHAHYTIAVEAFTDRPQDATAERNVPVGAGKTFFKPMAPLNPDPQALEVSDLVVGVEPPPGFNKELLPYPVAPSSQIRKADELKVYLEIYHLQPGRDGAGRFNLDFRVARLEPKGQKLKRTEIIASAFDFQSAGQTAKEDFSIALANLKPGDYELEVEVRDKISGMSKQRKAPFQIMKKEEG